MSYAKLAERLKRLWAECRHILPRDGFCTTCVSYMVLEYEERIVALEDKRCDDGGWPLRDGPTPTPEAP